MTLLSVGRIYRLVRLIPVPLLSGERASIRMVILPVVFLLILAAIEFQRWLQNRQPSWIVQLTGLGMLLVMGHDLWQHAKVWQVTNAVSAFDVARVDLSIKVVANHPDPAYFTMLGDRRRGEHTDSARADLPVAARGKAQGRLNRSLP